MSQESQEYKFELDLTFEDSHDLDLSLGIKRERALKIFNHVEESFKQNNNAKNCIKDCLNICKSNNEVAYILFMSGRYFQNNSIQTQ
jgi:hypothetical protein